MLPSGYVGASRLSNSTTADLMNDVNFRFVLSSLALPDYRDRISFTPSISDERESAYIE